VGEKVLPEMAFRMGLDNSPLNTISFEDQAAILVLPDRPDCTGRLEQLKAI
jgi:hypothetical protein